MSPLESTDRHTASSQKLLPSKQSTPHGAPALEPSPASDLFPPSPQSLNLVSQHLLDRTQTGDSNLVDITTIDTSYKGKVPLDGVGEEAVFEGQNTPCDMDSFRSHTCLGRASRYAPRSATLGIQWFRSISSLGIEWSPPVEDIDILHTGNDQPDLAGIDTLFHSTGTDRRGRRGGDLSHFSFSSPSHSFFFFSLLPRQALGRASFLLAWILRRWHSSHSSFLHVSTL